MNFVINTEKKMYWCIKTSVADPWNFGTDPDADPYLWLMNPDADPDPAILVSDLSDVTKQIEEFYIFCLLLFEGTFFIIFRR